MNPTIETESGPRWLERLTADSDNVQFMMGVALAVLIVAIVVTGRTIRAVAREKTKREIAAYIAEGSMSPEQGERLIKSKHSGCA
ncbi:MAG: hypothetical protein IT435_11275 [Phycisphaerales bacterium]|nr:hypothetical protein [Phycisphaerales bacterium]